MLARPDLLRRIFDGLAASPVVALIGPRQCGKTTLAREIAARRRAMFFDLEDPEALEALSRPKLVLGPLKGLVVIDEIQRRPDLFPFLRVLADRRPLRSRFLILGSASPELVRGASESLAGRIHFVDTGGFTLPEVGVRASQRLWLRGGFPRAFLARGEAASLKWRQDFVRTFLERDMPQLGIHVSSEHLRRFWTMVAHYHGQTWNGSEIGGSLGVSHHTTRHYLDVLTEARVLRQLSPWFENVGKRVVKSPKVYVRDSGLLHALLGIRDRRGLMAHPKLGASWEGFVIEQLLTATGGADAHFWATHGRAELDLLLHARGRRWGFEMKCQDAPGMTASLGTAIRDLDIHRAWIVYPGSRRYPVDDRVEVVPLADALREATRLG